MKRINKIFNLILPIITIVFLLIVWQVVALEYDNKYIVPTVDSTLKELGVLLGEKKFYIALGSTLLRSVIAFSLSFFVSAILAYCASKRVWAEKLILPIISITRTLPTIAIAWLLLFWTNSQVAPVVITSSIIKIVLPFIVFLNSFFKTKLSATLSILSCVFNSVWLGVSIAFAQSS